MSCAARWRVNELWSELLHELKCMLVKDAWKNCGLASSRKLINGFLLENHELLPLLCECRGAKTGEVRVG